MRACAYAVTVLVLVAALGSVGCETVNNYACDGVSDGGCAMGRYDDDEDGGGASEWRDGAQLSGSQSIAIGETTELINAGVRGGVPRVMGVSLGYAFVPLSSQGNAVAADCETVALITLGIGGTAFQAEVDFVNGTQFSVVAAFVTVKASYREIAGSPTHVKPAPVTVAASLAMGSLASGVTPQRTLGQDSIIAPNAYVVYNIPAFAKSFRVATQPSAPNLKVWVVRASIVQGTEVNVVTALSESIPIPNGAYAVWVQNVDAAKNVDQIRLIFDLAI